MLSRKFIFPTDTIYFGKYVGRKIGDIIEEDKPYFDWMLKQDFEINPLLINLRNGIDIVSSEIKHTFNKPTQTLFITLVRFWQSHHIKGVRKSKKRIIDRQTITSYKCELPFRVEVKKWTEHIDCTKFHNDSIEVEKQETIYHYNERDLEQFINSKLKKHGLI